jgi:hypothetical protein
VGIYVAPQAHSLDQPFSDAMPVYVFTKTFAKKSVRIPLEGLSPLFPFVHFEAEYVWLKGILCP